MVDLTGLHARMRPALDAAMARVMEASAFIKGAEVAQFEARLETVMNLGGAAIGCGNGTDALTLALMALEVGPGDEVIVPDFSFISTAETVALRGAIPVFVDIDPRTFQLDLSSAQRAISPRTKAVVPVHLFGQCADMQPLMIWALEHGLKVIEDNAQSLGATCHGASGLAAGTVGHLGTTSFFPSKNLGCMGDGGAVLVGQATLPKNARRWRRPFDAWPTTAPRGSTTTSPSGSTPGWTHFKRHFWTSNSTTGPP